MRGRAMARGSRRLSDYTLIKALLIKALLLPEEVTEVEERDNGSVSKLIPS